MVKKIPTRKPAARYHHGDLRAALVRAGLELLRKEGFEALSLRAVARRAGVSQTAPYSHFTDKNALLAAIAAEGLRTLGSRQRACAALSDVPTEQMLAMARTYVGMACDEPALFQLMLGPGAPEKYQSPEVDEAHREGFLHLRSVVAAVAGTGIDAPETWVAMMAAWSMVHGMAQLLTDGKISPAMVGLQDRDQLVTLIIKAVAGPG